MTKIHQEIFGKGKTIVLVHGWAMHAGIWREFAMQLAQFYRVILVDLPGHGHSEKINSFTLEQVTAELVKAIPEESCCWLGWSLGATVVLDIAARYPERVTSLMLLAGNPLFIQTAQWPGMNMRLLDEFSGHLTNDCQATLLRFLSLQVRALPTCKTLIKALKTSVFECEAPDNNTLQGGLAILKQTDLRFYLSKLTMPVSVVLGGMDALVPVDAGQKMQQLLPQLDLNIIESAGHVPFLSHSSETLAIISRFMDQQCI